MPNNEKLSAFVDGELKQNDFVDSLLKDDELSDQFSRYHLIGDVMRGETADEISFDISESVMAALEDEPTVMAPQPEKQVQTGFVASNVVPLFKKVGQYAIAASVAASVVVGVQLNTAQQDNLTPVPVLDTVPLVGVAEPVSLNTEPEPKDQLTEEQILEQRQKINALLQDHSLQQRLLQE